MLDQAPRTADTARRGPALRPATPSPAPAPATPAASGPAPRLVGDALGRQLQRAVVRRAQLARMLTVPPGAADKDFVGNYVERHSDEKRLPVDSVIRDTTGITAFKLKLPGTDGASPADFVEVSVTDPEYGWANDKASKRNWAKVKAAQAPAPAAAAPAAQHWLAGKPPTTDSNTVFTLPTSRIRYTQDSISVTFSKPTPSGARTVHEAVAALKAGRDTLDRMPELMIVPSGPEAVRSFDNRRLWVAKRAQKGEVRVRWASAQEQRTNSFKWTGDGKSVTVRQ